MESTYLALGREALLVVLTVSAPPLLATLAVGLVTGVLQAATQVQEQSIGVVPRLAAVLVSLGFAGPWIGARVVRFAAACLDLERRVPDCVRPEVDDADAQWERYRRLGVPLAALSRAPPLLVVTARHRRLAAALPP